MDGKVTRRPKPAARAPGASAGIRGGARAFPGAGDDASLGRTARLIVRLAGAAAGLFYRVDRTGPRLPEGPTLVVVNHPNSLLDAVLVLRCNERFVRPLARAPLFDSLLLGPVVRMLGAIPVHRRQDDPEAMHRNEDMFRDAVAALRRGEAIQIYPEGRSHSEAGVVALRTGAARIALRAEDDADWRLGLSIVPIGITYSRKERARTGATVRLGRAFSCRDLKDAYRRDAVAAVRTLTDRIERGIRDQTLNFVRREHRALVEVAERLYVRELRWVPWRAREALGARFPRLQRFAAGLERLRLESPEEHGKLVRQVERYARLAARLGTGRGEAPSRYELLPVVRYVGARGPLLALGAPLAAVGATLWAPIILLAGAAARRARPRFEVLATYKLVALLAGAICAWVFWTGVGYVAGGVRAAAIVAALAPASGYLTLLWVELAKEVREDTALFLRLQGRPDVRRRFARLRKELTQRFARLERRWADPSLRTRRDRGNVSGPGGDSAPSRSEAGEI